MSKNIKIIKCKGKLETFDYEPNDYFRYNFGHELGGVYCNFKLEDGIQFEGRTVKSIYIHPGLQSYIEKKKSWFNDKTNLTISFDEWEWNKDGTLSIGGENLEIKKKGSSSHSANATADSSNSLWIEEENEEENNQNQGAEEDNSNNVKPEVSTTTEPVESEKVAKVREIIEKGNEVIGGNDATTMKNIIQQLENIQNNGSAEEKQEFVTWGGGDLLNELKGKAAAIELEKEQSNSSQPDQPAQPSQADILASIQQENQAKKNDVDNKLNQAESENATKEEVAEAIKGSASNFGDENFQEQQQRQEALEEKLAVEDFELYLKTMIGKVSLCLEENNLKETDLKLTDELRGKWTRLNRRAIQDKNQVKEIVQQMQEQIIRQANEKELKSIQERVEKNKKKLLPENERKKLKDDIMRYIEKTKTNIYSKSNVSKGEALMREFNSSSKLETTKPDKFPWVPVSLGIGAAGILAVAVFVIVKKRKQKRK